MGDEHDGVGWCWRFPGDKHTFSRYFYRWILSFKTWTSSRVELLCKESLTRLSFHPWSLSSLQQSISTPLSQPSRDDFDSHQTYQVRVEARLEQG